MAADDTTERNRAAWSTQRYEAWEADIGPPAAAAAALKADPRHAVRRLVGHLGDVSGQRILNPQGSHGRIGVSLALLGAQVTVVDFVEENRRYAVEMAAAAGVSIDYRVGDVMDMASMSLPVPYDWVVMELGILHYHADLGAFLRLCASLTRPGGRLLLNEFHPVERKIFAGLGDGDYFETRRVTGPVPYPAGLDRPPVVCEYRFWTLGDVLTQALAAGYAIQAFEEHPSWDNPKIPGTFTLVAQRG